MRDREPDWHPIMAAVEGPTGTWRMVDPLDREYGTIEIRRVMNGTEIRYKAQRHGEVLRWATTLREACEVVHGAFLRSHGPGARSGAPQEWELQQQRPQA